ncbi:PTS sugar transporter subunit IIA [Lihuaxuella thermophila]|uniref:PTS system, D-glucosamine-specific IIC component/PTS system, glucose-specific IIA component n=1 Tax=Lihuaxuella thermophila TaxID=1173111 RepID=A0A1H8AIH6_9BACL|nr:PTS glucose transporter subunit IIA [Lihuaxuella thermophila]SEM70602.1 PTS system, D-glucosamine-specific IIC component/PTS system, glucose-specific IIA component [Lihuaxuella thermophila]
MLFWRKKKVEILAPITGEYLPLEQVPDQVFSQKIMGDGFAVNPEHGEVVSPVDGEVIHLFPTKHALGLKTSKGLEILVHVGIDTVELNGEGFTAHVSEGDQVKAGQKLLTFDIEQIKEKGKSPVSPIIFPQSADWQLQIENQGKLIAGTTLVATAEPKK